MKKRKISIFLSVLMTASLMFTTPAYASTTATYKGVSQNTLATTRQIVSAKLSSLNDVSLASYDGQQGVLYNLNVIIQESLWVEFTANNNNAIGYSDATLKYQETKLMDFIKQFNTEYGVKSGTTSESYIPVTIDESDINSGKLNPDTIVDQASQYLVKVMNGYVSQEKKDGLTKTVQDNRAELRLINEIVQGCTNTVGIVNNIIPVVYKDEGKTGLSSSESWYFDPTVDKITELTSNSNYQKLLEQAKELTQQEMKVINWDGVNSKDNLYQNFFVNGNTSSNDLTDVYWMLFSASSLYVPFQSKLDDTQFQQSIQELCNNGTDSASDLNFYAKTIEYLKPLYYVSVDSEGKPTGTATEINLGEFMSDVEEGHSGALVMPIGTLKQQGDMNSYAYYHDNRFSATTAVDGTSGDTSTKTTKTTTTSSTSATSDLGSTTPATESSTTGTLSSSSTEASGSEMVNTKITKGGKDNKLYNTVKSKVVKDSKGSSKAKTTTKSDSKKDTKLTASPNKLLLSANFGSEVNTSSSTTSGTTSTGGATNTTTTTTTVTTPTLEATGNTTSSQYYEDTGTISNLADVTTPVFEFMSKGEWDSPDLAESIAYDICKQYKSGDDTADGINKSSLLFMDAYGDIVTSNGTVIIPGSANPTLVNSGQDYYPYTYAFTSSYPQLNPDGDFQPLNSNEAGDYILGFTSDATVDGSTMGLGNSQSITDMRIGGSTSSGVVTDLEKLFGLDDTSSVRLNDNSSTTRKIMLTNDGFGTGGAVDLFTMKHYKFDNLLADLMSNSWDGLDILTFNTMTGGTGSNGSPVVFFSSKPSDLTSKQLGEIVNNYFWSIFTNSSGTMQQKPNGRMNVKLLADTVIPQALNGSSNPEVYQKNKIANYTATVKDAGNFISNGIETMVSGLTSGLNTLTGVLGLQNSYENPILGYLMQVSEKYALYACFIVAIIAIIKFMKAKTTLAYTIVVTAVMFCFTFIYIKVVPVYLPTVYNVVNNNLQQDLAYETLCMHAENYGKMYTVQYNSKGEIELSDNSINLYKLDTPELENLCASMGITVQDAESGRDYIINSTSGLYLQGNVIKEDLDLMFQTLAIVGGYKTGANGGVSYADYATKEVNTSVGYYTPYYQMVNSFLNKLNTFASDFNLVPSYLTYGNLSKASFLVNDYMDSPLFLTPGKYTDFNGNVTSDVISKMQQQFGQNQDFLGIGSFLESKDLSSQVTNSLWYKTLKQNGYLSNTEKMDKLIDTVNYQTKLFMIKNASVFKGMSDENIIKIVCLYEATVFDQQAGTWGNELYPVFINYQDFNLGDVMLATYVTNNNLFTSNTMKIVPYIEANYNVVMLVVFAICDLLVFLNVWSVTLLMPVLYLALGLLLLLKFIMSDQVSGVFKGYLKCNGLLIVIFSLNVFSFDLAHWLNGSYFGMFSMLIIQAMCFELLVRMMMMLIKNPFSLGNERMDMMMPYVAKKLMETSVMATIMGGVVGIRNKVKPTINNNVNTMSQDNYDMDYDFNDPHRFNRAYDNEGRSGRNSIIRRTSVDINDVGIDREEDYENDLRAERDELSSENREMRKENRRLRKQTNRVRRVVKVVNTFKDFFI